MHLSITVGGMAAIVFGGVFIYLGTFNALRARKAIEDQIRYLQQSKVMPWVYRMGGAIFVILGVYFVSEGAQGKWPSPPPKPKITDCAN